MRSSWLRSRRDSPDAAAELRSYDELVVGLPEGNLTILDLARKLASGLSRPSEPSDAARSRLARVVRHRPASAASAWLMASTKRAGVETASYLIQMSDGLGVSAVWMKGLTSRADAPATILLHDGGRAQSTAAAVERLNRGEQVLAVDLAFLGESWSERETRRLLQNITGLGERPVGLQAAELVAVARWLAARSGPAPLRLETTGIRSQLAALVAAALEPRLFTEIAVRDGMTSLGHALEKPVEYMDAPELFCLDLYKEFDVSSLAALAAPTRVR